MKKLLGLLVLLAVAVAVYLALTPSPIDPLAWTPPKAPPMTGVMEPNDTLMKAELLAQGQIVGPEDTAVDSQGRVFAGLDDGRIVRIGADGKAESFVETGGRPLGLAFDKNGKLIVADAWKGLLEIDPQGKIRVLTDSADGVPFAFTDDLDIASDGRIYFSDASSRFHQPDYILDLLEARPHGRLLRYDPATGKTETLLKDLYFANGVALSQNEDFVLVNETYRYRITRYWLKGEKAGQHEVFIDNLPGLPDNLASDRSGTFWVALPSPRKADADMIQQMPWLKRQLTKLPRAVLPKPVPYGLVIQVNEKGEIVRSLHDTSGQHLRMVTSAKPVNGVLYLGSLENDRIGRLPIH
ncbi:SMP-30/gluconolactonase/LRE family protein [Pseudomonas sp. PDM23]|uniref:SMP-30/gluconolactonase/LRE family protein n=1 Tax=unclassified Pseudomonas TaxID=196821 RepID=UPI00177FBFD9|nr:MULTISPECIES: SMP-30/gluconolactonase/LRE family protein [unclassified Pseudomonas]MBD9499851.1 SMP-30/gluconolactonase/LRE family protein [Pseudomonas sp. PDM17]MBD9575408.1 SMP-30/gluconolactonase/LRE family protein [Pseudomonas sp. PDM23]MBD9669650.1 SMP-30/gluconolactonase/LRE family protein [Pseudomonas sp. PDM21]